MRMFIFLCLHGIPDRRSERFGIRPNKLNQDDDPNSVRGL